MADQTLLPGFAPPPDYGDALDFYRTPRDAVTPVLPFIPRLAEERWNVLEPAAGDGAMLEWFLPHIPKPGLVTAIEINKRRALECGDTLHRIAPSSPWYVHNGDFLNPANEAHDVLQALANSEHPLFIPLNPPYSQPYEGIGMDFLERCLELAEQRPRRPLASRSVVAALLPNDFATGVDRVERIHDRWKCSFLPLKRRPYFGGEHSSGQRPFAWYVFDFLNPQQNWKPIG